MKSLFVAAVPLMLALAGLSGCDADDQESRINRGNHGGAAVTSTPPAVQTGFIEVQPTAVSGGVAAPCAIDQINSQDVKSTVNVEVGSGVRIVGWVSDPTLTIPPEFEILLSGDKLYSAKGKAGGSRPDVARALGSEALSSSGFNIVASMGTAPAGDYRVSLVQRAGEGLVRCDTEARIAVIESPN